MTKDARFEDGREAAVAIRAMDEEDLKILSALMQDAVLHHADMTWDRRRREFALLLNRYRWEDPGRTPPERVRSVVLIEDVLNVASQGLDQTDHDVVLSILALDWAAGDDGTGRVTVFFAGDGAIAVDVEALAITLKDVTKPYLAPSGQTPTHRD